MSALFDESALPEEVCNALNRYRGVSGADRFDEAPIVLPSDNPTDVLPAFGGRGFSKLEDASVLARTFRAAIDRACAAGELGDYPFDRFPHDCCDDACILLAQFFYENGLAVTRVTGELRSGFRQRHVWLALEDGTVVDITGDQFADDPRLIYFSNPVYVGPPGEFHRLFDVVERMPEPGIGNYSGSAAVRLWGLYRAIDPYL